MFTSGTTGRPKGVMAGARRTPTIRAFGPNGRVMSGHRTRRPLPDRQPLLPHLRLQGRLGGGLPARRHRLSAAGVRRRGGAGAHRADRISFLPGPPTLFLTMLAHPRLARLRPVLAALGVTGAASVPPVLIERMREELGIRNVTTAYGLTECGGCATVCDPPTAPRPWRSTCGHAMPGTEVRCVDADASSVPAARRARCCCVATT
jgi:acyl-CoA synthetase (AMP-forming)/AMP-acid ligase II